MRHRNAPPPPPIEHHLCCAKPELTMTWLIGSDQDSLPILAVEDVRCKICGASWRFEALCEITSDGSRVVLYMERKQKEVVQ